MPQVRQSVRRSAAAAAPVFGACPQGPANCLHRSRKTCLGHLPQDRGKPDVRRMPRERGAGHTHCHRRPHFIGMLPLRASPLGRLKRAAAADVATAVTETLPSAAALASVTQPPTSSAHTSIPGCE